MKILDIVIDKNHTTYIFKIYSDYDRYIFKHVIQALCNDYCFAPDIKEEILHDLPLKKKITVVIKTEPNEIYPCSK